MDQLRATRLDSALRAVNDIEAERLAGTRVSRLTQAPFDKARGAYVFDTLYLENRPPIAVTRHDRFSPTPPHYHYDIEFNIMYAGSLRQVIDGQEVRLSPGTISLVDTKTVHELDSADEGDILINIALSKEFLSERLVSALPANNLLTTFFVNALNSTSQQVNYLVFDTSGEKRLQATIEELIYESFFPSPNMHTEFLDQLFRLAVMDMLGCIDANVAYSRLSKSNLIVADALRIIDQQYPSCTLEGVAREVGVSAPYLTTLLKRNVGKSFIQLVTSKRMALARELLLTTDVTVEQVAHSCGYENLSFFYRKFREAHGCNPRELRMRRA